jgi:hypothetical protein
LRRAPIEKNTGGLAPFGEFPVLVLMSLSRAHAKALCPTDAHIEEDLPTRDGHSAENDLNPAANSEPFSGSTTFS